ncbi:phage protein [Bordetella pertussis]|mgnify:CR=1 FL=1|uniref:Uncharacterized protein n=3 Tax=Bordetella pertussis TaxID=520 RepID=Q7VTY8_BORPE|nr:hypothetical protein [Bordetella pertussis]AEE68507.1 hypothetical protein BPTD_3314 [Bordetella pertussis CS]PNO99282.1 hypothetical protein AL465_011105 [Bordetella pertussis 18323]CAE43623.1 phage-related hypothetical protein [Bordetella pertussis Tohama I]AIW93382.1 hypothetical protein B1917_3140 [Bordetella pertussis B1917]AIW94691.1 hypothetical protein B1920_0705 [Bordetella pertussis B1920]
MIGVGVCLWADSTLQSGGHASRLLLDGKPFDTRAPLSLGTQARISGGRGDESLSGPLAGGPARRVKGYLPALPDGKLVARFSSVAELTGVSDAWMGGTSVGSGRRAQVFHFRKIDDQKEVQLQIVAGQYTKAVKVRFYDDRDGIKAGVMYARYVEGSQLGLDFDIIEARSQEIATAESEIGYGCAAISLVGIQEYVFLTYALDSDVILTVSGANTYIGTTTVESGTVRIGHPLAFGRNGLIKVRAGAALDKHGYALPHRMIVNDGATVLE